MKDLATRKADRKRRAEENRERAERDGLELPQSDSDFNVDTFLDGNVGDVTGRLGDLSDEQLEEVANAGDERAGVKSAIESEQKRRAQRSGTDWQPNV